MHTTKRGCESNRVAFVQLANNLTYTDKNSAEIHNGGTPADNQCQKELVAETVEGTKKIFCKNNNTKLFVFGDSHVDTGNFLDSPSYRAPYGMTYLGKHVGNSLTVVYSLITLPHRKKRIITSDKSWIQ